VHQSEVEDRLEGFRTSVREFITDLVPPGWRGIGELSGESREEFRIAARAALVQRRWRRQQRHATRLRPCSESWALA
jgi:hypothetical protein